MIKIYGSPRSSAGRCYLLLEEVGARYQQTPLDMMDKREHKGEAFLRLNPNGKVPVLVDGDLVLWESLAINQYLAEKYKPSLLGRGPQDKAVIQQWSLWAMLELQPPLVDIIIQTKFIPEEKRDPNVVAKAREKVPPALRILDNALKGHEYILGPEISLADFNVGSVVNTAIGLNMPLTEYPNIEKWMKHLRERPSFAKFLELRK